MISEYQFMIDRLFGDTMNSGEKLIWEVKRISLALIDIDRSAEYDYLYIQPFSSQASVHFR